MRFARLLPEDGGEFRRDARIMIPELIEKLLRAETAEAGKVADPATQLTEEIRVDAKLWRMLGYVLGPVAIGSGLLTVYLLASVIVGYMRGML